MISIGVWLTGFYRDRLPEITEKLTTAMQGIFGSDINLDPSTQDGQMIAAFAEAIDDTAQALEDVYNGINPNAATGANLTALSTINGIDRIMGGYSYVNCLVTVASGATLPIGTQVRDVDTGTIYETQSVVTGNGSAQSVTCRATTTGSTSLAGKVTEIVTPTYGFVSVTNPAESTTVAAYETDEQLRIRRAQSTAAPSQSMIESVRAAVLAVPGLTDLKLWENATGVQADAKTGDLALPPHSITAVVVGGEASAIGQALYNTKSLGCTTNGTTSVVVSDSVGNAQTMRYTVATPVAVNVDISYTERPGQGFGGAGGEAAVAAAIAEWATANQHPGGDVPMSWLSKAALAAVTGLDGLPAFTIQAIAIGRSGGSMYNDDLAIAYNEIATISSDDVSFGE